MRRSAPWGVAGVGRLAPSASWICGGSRSGSGRREVGRPWGRREPGCRVGEGVERIAWAADFLDGRAGEGQFGLGHGAVMGQDTADLVEGCRRATPRSAAMTARTADGGQVRSPPRCRPRGGPPRHRTTTQTRRASGCLSSASPGGEHTGGLVADGFEVAVPDAPGCVALPVEPLSEFRRDEETEPDACLPI